MLWFNKKDENYEEEIWKKVENYEDYEVSNLGHCRRLNQDGTYSNIGYIDVSQSRIKVELKNEKGERKQTTLGHLVAETFLPNPDNCKWAKNIDGDFMNNRVDNLKWVKKSNREKIEVEYNDKDRIDNELKKANKDFLKQAKEINKEVTLKDIYDKLNELIEVIKNDNR